MPELREIYADRLRPVSHLRIGASNYYLHGQPDDIARLLAAYNIAYDDLEPSPLNPQTGVIRIWKIGDLRDRLLGAPPSGAAQQRMT